MAETTNDEAVEQSNRIFVVANQAESVARSRSGSDQRTEMGEERKKTRGVKKQRKKKKD
jgi:hypothetical protein